MLKRIASVHSLAVRAHQSSDTSCNCKRIYSHYFTSGSDRDPSSAPIRSTSWVEREEHQEKHWLDRAFPGSREWLENQNRKWWFASLAANSRKYPNLQGRDQEIARLTEGNYQNILTRHADKVVDDRAQTHLQVACLMLASYRVLQPFIRNDQEVLDIIRAQAGDRSSALLSYLLRFSLLFTRDPFASSVRRLRALKLDLGRSFATSDVKEDERSAQLEIHSCLYNNVFAEEGAEQLLECCCCSQDAVWFDKLERHGVGFERRAWLGGGDNVCCLRLQQLRN